TRNGRGGTKSRLFYQVRRSRCVRELSRFFGCQRTHWSERRLSAHDFHLFPVVRQLFAAIQAHDVGSRGECSLAATALLDCDREAVMVVPATEESVDYPRQHLSTSHRCSRPGSRGKHHLLRFPFCGKGSQDYTEVSCRATLLIKRIYRALPSGPLFLWDLQRVAIADRSLVSRSSGSS